MNRFLRPFLVGILLLAVFIPVCFAENENVLSGSDLLKVVRQKQATSPRPAYAEREVRPAKPFVAADQNQAQEKSADDKLSEVKLRDYKKETKNSDTQTTIPDIKRRMTDVAVQRPSDKAVTFSAVRSEIPFGRAIDILRNSVKPPLNIFVHWRDLEESANIDRATLVNVDGISNVPLGTALVLLLNSASADVQLGYTVEDNVIIIATRRSLPRRQETRLYDVACLLSTPADYRGRLGTSRSANANVQGGHARRRSSGLWRMG